MRTISEQRLNWRRDKGKELSVKGYAQRRIADKIKISLDSGVSCLNSPAKSVWVFFRKNGNSIGNITVRVRKDADLVILVVVFAQLASNIMSSGGSSSDGGNYGTG